MNKPKYTKTDYMRELDDGAQPATKEALRVMEKECPPSVKRKGMWLQRKRRSVFDASYIAKLKNSEVMGERSELS